MQRQRFAPPQSARMGERVGAAWRPRTRMEWLEDRFDHYRVQWYFDRMLSKEVLTIIILVLGLSFQLYLAGAFSASRWRGRDSTRASVSWQRPWGLRQVDEVALHLRREDELAVLESGARERRCRALSNGMELVCAWPPFEPYRTTSRMTADSWPFVQPASAGVASSIPRSLLGQTSALPVDAGRQVFLDQMHVAATRGFDRIAGRPTLASVRRVFASWVDQASVYWDAQMRAFRLWHRAGTCVWHHALPGTDWDAVTLPDPMSDAGARDQHDTMLCHDGEPIVSVVIRPIITARERAFLALVVRSNVLRIHTSDDGIAWRQVGRGVPIAVEEAAGVSFSYSSLLDGYALHVPWELFGVYRILTYLEVPHLQQDGPPHVPQRCASTSVWLRDPRQCAELMAGDPVPWISSDMHDVCCRRHDDPMSGLGDEQGSDHDALRGDVPGIRYTDVVDVERLAYESVDLSILAFRYDNDDDDNWHSKMYFGHFRDGFHLRRPTSRLAWPSTPHAPLRLTSLLHNGMFLEHSSDIAGDAAAEPNTLRFLAAGTQDNGDSVIASLTMRRDGVMWMQSSGARDPSNVVASSMLRTVLLWHTLEQGAELWINAAPLAGADTIESMHVAVLTGEPATEAKYRSAVVQEARLTGLQDSTRIRVPLPTLIPARHVFELRFEFSPCNFYSFWLSQRDGDGVAAGMFGGAIVGASSFPATHST